MAKVNQTSLDLQSAMRFLQVYYPEMWERVEEADIIRLVTISHTLFKSHPTLLESPADQKYVPVQ